MRPHDSHSPPQPWLEPPQALLQCPLPFLRLLAQGQRCCSVPQTFQPTLKVAAA